jgi:hypothetical protein
MKNLICALFALAIVYHNAGVDDSSFTNVTANYDVIFVGTDVPSGYLAQTISLTGSPLALSTTTINAGIAAAVRAQAISDGFTVPVSSVVMQSWQSL